MHINTIDSYTMYQEELLLVTCDCGQNHIGFVAYLIGLEPINLVEKYWIRYMHTNWKLQYLNRSYLAKGCSDISIFGRLKIPNVQTANEKQKSQHFVKNSFWY